MRSFSFSSFIANSCLLSFFLLYLLSAVGEISTGKELYQPSPIGCLYYSLHTWVIECMYLYMCVCVCSLAGASLCNCCSAAWPSCIDVSSSGRDIKVLSLAQ